MPSPRREMVVGSRSLSVLVAVLMSASTGLDAHRGSRVYPIYEVPTAGIPVLGDGSLEDWESVVPGPSLIPADLESVASSPDPGDFTARVFLSWHWASQRLFVGLERLDDIVVNSYDGSATNRYGLQRQFCALRGWGSQRRAICRCIDTLWLQRATVLDGPRISGRRQACVHWFQPDVAPHV